MTEKKGCEAVKRLLRESLERLAGLVKVGNATRVRVYHKENKVLELPLTVGAVGLAAAPSWAVLAATVATFGLDCVVDLVREDGQVFHVI